MHSRGSRFQSVNRNSRPCFKFAQRMWWILYGILLMLNAGECFGRSKIQPAHCWSNTNCTGRISQSFRQEKDCCKYGAKSYIKCTNLELKMILIKMRGVNVPQYHALPKCVPCPVKKATTTAKPNAKCTPSTCLKRNEQCVEIANTKTTYCVNCKYLNCDKSQRVCGTDNITYKDECSLRCLNTLKVDVAYSGPCIANPTCSSVKCKKGFLCSLVNSRPRCKITQIVCGVNNVTYASFFDLKREICQTGQLNVLKHYGPCNPSDIPKVVTLHQPIIPCNNFWNLGHVNSVRK